MPEYLNSDQPPERDLSEWSEAVGGVFIQAKTASQIMLEQTIEEFEEQFKNPETTPLEEQ